MANYGIPYQGSKDKLIHKLAAVLPAADNFYDLFGGGFSVSHFMCLHKKYKTVHYNEIESTTVQLVRDAIAGKYAYSVFKPRWVTPEEFEAKKKTCAYTRIIWSFGNNQKDYLFGKGRRDDTRSLHQAIVFDEWDDVAIDLLKRNSFPKELSIRGKRLACRKIIFDRKGELQQLERLQQLEQLERLQQLEQLQRLQRLQRLEMSSLSYEQVSIKPNSIVYCDPPYKNTAEYLSHFDHEKFWDWVRNNEHPVFVSEYTAPSDINTVMAIRHQKTNSQTSTASVEKLFCNKAAQLLSR